MPVHGIRLNLEFLAIVTGAATLSYFVSDIIVSNFLFTTLIMVLFFLIGLHLDRDRLKKLKEHEGETALGWAMVYLVTPLLAFGFSYLIGGSIGEAFIAIGVSAAALGSPVVWSNLGDGEGDFALVVAGSSLILGAVAIPALLLGMNYSFPAFGMAAKNLLFLFGPLLAGLIAQRYENFLFDDLRHHFSKVALWLLILVMGIQVKIVYSAQGAAFFNQMGLAMTAMGAFVTLSIGIGYLVPRQLGVMERKSRALGFVSGSKEIGVALFIASPISGPAVAFVLVYYFIRQAVCGVMAGYFRSTVTVSEILEDPMAFVE